jgi:hypothetical protein
MVSLCCAVDRQNFAKEFLIGEHTKVLQWILALPSTTDIVCVFTDFIGE